MPVGLLALALGGFGIGLTEFVIAGLLTPVANDLGVSVPTAGYLVSGYALAVVFGADALWAIVGLLIGGMMAAPVAARETQIRRKSRS